MLIDIRSAYEIRIGHIVKTYRDDVGILTMARASEGKSGRVYVRFPGRDDDCELFPSVIGARFVA